MAPTNAWPKNKTVVIVDNGSNNELSLCSCHALINRIMKKTAEVPARKIWINFNQPKGFTGKQNGQLPHTWADPLNVNARPAIVSNKTLVATPTLNRVKDDLNENVIFSSFPVCSGKQGNRLKIMWQNQTIELHNFGEALHSNPKQAAVVSEDQKGWDPG